jgi:hypothetical protein
MMGKGDENKLNHDVYDEKFTKEGLSNWFDRNEITEIESFCKDSEENPGIIVNAIDMYLIGISKGKECFEYFRSIILLYFLNSKKYGNQMHRSNLNDYIKQNLNDEVKKEYIKEIQHCQGFFEIKEFDFLDEGKEYLLDKEIVLENDKAKFSFIKPLENMYKKLYNELNKKINEKYPSISQIENVRKITFANMNAKNKELLSLCLKVSSKGSLTGIVDKVKINDMISNEYANIMREFDIDKLTLVDTCGLDHISDIPRKKLVKNFNELYYEILNSKHYNIDIESDESFFSQGNVLTSRMSENSLSTKMNEVAILYVKKLDSGKPDELRVILPCIRQSIPKAPIYTLFSGIDIFYRNKKEIEALNWNVYDEGKRCPKAVGFVHNLYKEQNDISFNENDENSHIKNFIGTTRQLLVLKNNIIAYCGNGNKVKDNYFLQSSNYKYIRKLISSIAAKEYSSLEIIEWDTIRKSEQIKKIVSEIIQKLFFYASRKSYSFRWNTIYANDSSFLHHKMGYENTYQHRFYQLFHEGYTMVVERDLHRIVIDNNKDNNIESVDAIESAIINMESRFLGSNDNLYKIEQRGNEFRRHLEKMYRLGKIKEVYKINIFDENALAIYLNNGKIVKPKRKEIFDDIFNFYKGLEVELDVQSDELKNMKDEFVKCFIKILGEQISVDNKQKSLYILRLSEEYFDELNKMEEAFNEKYGGNISFRKLMEYSFSSKN